MYVMNISRFQLPDILVLIAVIQTLKNSKAGPDDPAFKDDECSWLNILTDFVIRREPQVAVDHFEQSTPYPGPVCNSHI